MSEVVTGEAVVLSVRVAALASRAVALLIDLVVQGIALAVTALLLVGAGSVVDDALGTALYILVTALVIVGYPVTVETATRGRSLGKMAMGLRVVGDDGGPERFRQALFRGLAGVFEIWVTSGAVALVSSLVSVRGKRLGDVFAGTIVIDERAPRETPPPPMPPGLEGWAQTLELSRLPNDLANAARHYLGRWQDLTPEIRHTMGMRLASQVSAYVAPAPPPNVAPYAYLAAVMAERRRRAQARQAARASTPPQHRTTPGPARPGEPPDTASSGGFTPPS